MKVFADDKSSWPDKVNFVDKNNVFVGYNIGNTDSEYADWFISDSISKLIPDDIAHNFNIDDYIFDKEFFQKITYNDGGDKKLGEGVMVVFRIVDSFKNEKFLHLFNCHNGYYGHGFHFKTDVKTIVDYL